MDTSKTLSWFYNDFTLFQQYQILFLIGEVGLNKGNLMDPDDYWMKKGDAPLAARFTGTGGMA